MMASLRSGVRLSRAAKRDPMRRLCGHFINPFGRSGYVALFEIDDDETVTVLAIRHRLEEDNH